MQVNRFYVFTLIFFSLILGYLSYNVLKPFLSPILWAIVLTIVFYPLYAYISRYIRWRTAASLIVVAIIIMVIIGPFTYLIITLGKEIKQISTYSDSDVLAKIIENPTVAWILGKVQVAFGIEDVDIDKLVVKNISTIGKDLIGRITESAKDIVTALINFIFMGFSLFFLLREGPDFMSKIRDYLPFSDAQKDRLVSQIKDMVISTIYGGVIVALSQGLLGGVAFFALGISSPAIWGTAIAIMSFIPMLGTFSIWGPACVYLFIQSKIIKGFILLVIGAFGISMIDNILKPIIISGRTKMHTLVIFFSVLGGIKLFGLLGLIMGPLVVALFISVFEIFRNIEECSSFEECPPDSSSPEE